MAVWRSAWAVALTVVALVAAPASRASAAPAPPPPVQLIILNGHVWLFARDATLSQILAEWARIGQTMIVNAERVPSGRLTIELSGLPEQEALDLLLRSTSGFVSTQRTDKRIVDSRSQFERIVIVARSNAPAGDAPGNLMPGYNAMPGAPTPRAEGDVPPPSAYPPQFAPMPQQAGSVAPPYAGQAPHTVPTVTPGVHRVVGADGQPIPDDQEDAPVRIPQPPPASLPPGFAAPPQSAPQPATTARPGPQGVPVPGMIVAPPAQPGQPGQPQPQRPPR